MDCQEFLDRFSDFYDGRTGPGESEWLQAHLDGCESCRRYLAVVEDGVSLLRSLPSIDVPDDFRSRLRHRLYHVEDGPAISGAMGSGAAAVTVLAMALLLTFAAWSPVIRTGEPEVALPAIVVDEPPREGPGLTLFTAPRVTEPTRPPEHLWVHSHSLLYEYSPLNERYRRAFLTRAGLD